ncbi:hypothetical protein A2U01_0098988, partial [Trifolium medium]|nr:hypothetical protein [Trifolium medium]
FKPLQWRSCSVSYAEEEEEVQGWLRAIPP